MHHKTEGALKRLHDDAEARILERDRIVKEKEQMEILEADYLANRMTDKKFINENPRTVEEFMDDQIRFE